MHTDKERSLGEADVLCQDPGKTVSIKFLGCVEQDAGGIQEKGYTVSLHFLQTAWDSTMTTKHKKYI